MYSNNKRKGVERGEGCQDGREPFYSVWALVLMQTPLTPDPLDLSGRQRPMKPVGIG